MPSPRAVGLGCVVVKVPSMEALMGQMQVHGISREKTLLCLTGRGWDAKKTPQ